MSEVAANEASFSSSSLMLLSEVPPSQASWREASVDSRLASSSKAGAHHENKSQREWDEINLVVACLEL